MGTDKLQYVAEITKVNFGIHTVMQLGVNLKNYIYYIFDKILTLPYILLCDKIVLLEDAYG